MFSDPAMTSTIFKLRNKIDSITKFLTPLLNIANCHMVEFITQNHWDTLLPASLRESLEGTELDDAVEQFWCAATSQKVKGEVEV